MRTGIFGMHWRINKRQPRCIPFGEGIPINVAIANGGDRTPEIVCVLRVKYRPYRIVRCHRGNREKPSIEGKIPIGAGLHDGYIDYRVYCGPKGSDLGLLWGAFRVRLRAEFFDFVVIACPDIACQFGWWTGAELFALIQHPRFAQCHSQRDRQQGWHVFASGGEWPVAFDWFLVHLASGEHRFGSRRTKLATFFLPLLRKFGDGSSISSFDRFFLAWEHRQKHVMVGGCNSRLW